MQARFGASEFATDECRVVISPIHSTRVLVVLEGRDRGGLGREPFNALETHLSGAESVDLYFDLERAGGASLDVSGSWALWLRANRVRLRRVGMLTGSSFVALSARTVERFAGLGSKARIYADRASFERDLNRPS
jgi:hypothetical protein